MDKNSNNYDDDFGYITDDSSQYDYDNFDKNGIKEKTVKKPAKNSTENKTEDYGDNFNSQTGDNADDYVYNDSYDINERSKNPVNKRKKKANSTAVIVLVV